MDPRRSDRGWWALGLPTAPQNTMQQREPWAEAEAWDLRPHFVE